MNQVKTIEYKTMSEITAERIREAIITGGLEAGARITETDVAERMGVSRVVVRESFLMLVREGLLIKERNRYTKIVDFDRRDIADIFDLRIAIEQAAAKRCLEAGRQLDELAKISDDITRTQFSSGFSFIDLMYKDISFHDTMVRRSENRRLINVWEETLGPILMLLYRYVSSGGKGIHYSHDELVDALAGGDSATVVREVAQHIEDTKQALLKRYG